LDARIDPAARAAMFHASLAHAVCEQALVVREHCGVERVGLSGGVFQNRILTEHVQALLTAAGVSFVADPADLDEEALFALQLPPGAPSVERQLRLVVVTGPAQLAAAQPGDVAVLAGDEVAPAGYTLIEEESVTGPTQLFGPSRRVPLVDVYLRR